MSITGWTPVEESAAPAAPPADWTPVQEQDQSPSLLDKAEKLGGRVWNALPGVGSAQRLSGAVEDYANAKLHGQNMEGPAATFGLGVARDVAGLVHGVTSPSGVGTAAAAAVAPEIVGPALVAHGIYSGAKGWGDLRNPDVLQSELNSGAEVAGGAALSGQTIKSGGGPVTQAVRQNIQQNASARAPMEASADFQRAIPPKNSAPYTQEDYEAARPYLELEHKGSAINTPEDLRDAADSAIGNIEDHIAQYIKANPQDQITTNPLQDARQVLSQNVRKNFVSQGLSELDDYPLDKPLTVQQADDIRRQLNQDNKAVLKKNNYDIGTAQDTDPGFAARQAAAESLRNGIYDKLAQRGIPDVDELRLDEGSLIKIRNAAQNQVFKPDQKVAGTSPQGLLRRMAGRGATISGAAAGAQFGPLGAAAGAEAGGALAEAISPQNLTRSELLARSFGKEVATPPQFPAIPARPPVAGLLPSGPLVTPPSTSASTVTAVSAPKTLQRNPFTGRIQRVYLGTNNP